MVMIRGRADGRLLAPADADRYTLGPSQNGYSVPTAAAVGDVDGDGDLDVAAGFGVKEDMWYPPNTSRSLDTSMCSPTTGRGG